jgi:hypothetical protein
MQIANLIMKTAMNKKKLKSDFSFPTRASARTGLLVLLALGLGLAAGGVWYWRLSKSHVEESVEAPTPGIVLSQTTTRILAGLDTTINLNLFAPADASALPATLNGFVTRVESLLAEYERTAAGKLRVTKCDPQSDAAAKAAAGAAGVVPFASDNGEIVYLGLTVGNGAHIESISPLAPEWEAALESDVTRAIQRVSTKTVVKTQMVNQNPAQPLPIDPAISEELLRMFPDLASQSFDDAAKVLRETTGRSPRKQIGSRSTSSDETTPDGSGRRNQKTRRNHGAPSDPHQGIGTSQRRKSPAGQVAFSFSAPHSLPLARRQLRVGYWQLEGSHVSSNH